MDILILLLIRILTIYFWIIVASVMMSWLLAFNVVSLGNRVIYNINAFLNFLTLPVYRQLRRVIPPIAGIDLTPMVVIFAVYFLQNILAGLL